MNDQPAPKSDQPAPAIPPETHCEWCGAPFETDAPPPNAARAAADAPVGVDAVGETHCEWCGAEYPEPRDAGPHVHPPTT
jgi:hypothetical protein